MILILMLYATSSSAQQLYVLSAESDRPIPGAHVILQSLKKNQQSKHFNTDMQGGLLIPQTFIGSPTAVTIRYIGYSDYADTLTFNNADKKIYMVTGSNTTDFEEVVVTAQYKKQIAQESVHQVKVINERQIKNMAAQNLKDALSNTLNVRLSEDNILGSRMQLQGIGGQNVKILVDGVPLTGRLDGNIDISQIPMENVARIEIIEGPLSVQYGTDALAGTINIITKKNNESSWNIQSNNYYESNGRFNNTGQLRWGKGKHQVVLNGGRYFFDGWKNNHPNFFYDRAPVADSSRVMAWNPKEQYFGNLNYRFQKEKLKINVSSANFTEEVINRGAPRPPYEQVAFDDYYNTDRLNQRLQLNYQVSKHSNLNFIAAYNGYFRTKNTLRRDLTTIEDVPSPNASDHDTSHFHTILSRGRWTYSNDSSAFQFALGYDFNFDKAIGKRIQDGSQSILDAALFGSLEYQPIEAVNIRPGIRWAYNTDYPAPAVPSIHAKFRLFKNAQQRLDLRTSYARGFRSPSIKELHFYFVDVNHNIQGNEDLKAETSHNANFSLMYNIRFDRMEWTNKINGFYNDISNMITLSQAGQTLFSYFNLERFKTTGLQFQTSLKNDAFNFQFGTGYVGRQNQLSISSDSNNGFLFSPEAQAALQFHFKSADIRSSLFYKYTGRLPTIRQDQDGNLEEQVIEDYHMLDASLSRQFWNDRLELTLGLKNAFDVRTVVGSGNSSGAHSAGAGVVQVGTGRTYFMRLNINIKSNKQ
ncbi:MAG: TonB-dependent receptor plug domain-containing protein [Bacteroidota bacterium]